jgi:hypothetical protein
VVDTREIPRSQWSDFFSGFSSEHDDEPVAIEVLGSDLGAQIEGRALQLRGISPANDAAECDVALMLDTVDGGHLTHMVPRVARVWVQETASSVDEALEIESADGTKTLIRFEARGIEEDDTAIHAQRFPRKGDDEDAVE